MTPPRSRLAIAVAETAPSINEDDAPFAAQLRAHGVEAVPAVWSDLNVDWTGFDAVLIRSTWDYHTRYPEFLRWLDHLESISAPTINPVAVLRWNSDKRYLLELAAHGVEAVATRIAHHAELASVLADFAPRELVIKPTVSAGAWSTICGRAADPAFAAAIEQLPRELTYLVQPFVAEVATAGEWSLLFFGGDYSHAVCKTPAPNDYRVQREFGGRTEVREPERQILRAAARALDAVRAMGYENIDYARIDGVVSEGRFLIMEVELIEPFLFLHASAEAPRRLARAVLERLRARGRLHLE